MKFQLTKASVWDYKEEVEINTLEELVEFSNKYNPIDNNRLWYQGIILRGNQIKIYDDYIE